MKKAEILSIAQKLAEIRRRRWSAPLLIVGNSRMMLNALMRDIREICEPDEDERMLEDSATPSALFAFNIDLWPEENLRTLIAHIAAEDARAPWFITASSGDWGETPLRWMCVEIHYDSTSSNVAEFMPDETEFIEYYKIYEGMIWNFDVVYHIYKLVSEGCKIDITSNNNTTRSILQIRKIAKFLESEDDDIDKLFDNEVIEPYIFAKTLAHYIKKGNDKAKRIYEAVLAGDIYGDQRWLVKQEVESRLK